MHIITPDHIVCSFRRSHRPVQKVGLGDKIRFETYDAPTDPILSGNDLLIPHLIRIFFKLKELQVADCISEKNCVGECNQTDGKLHANKSFLREKWQTQRF